MKSRERLSVFMAILMIVLLTWVLIPQPEAARLTVPNLIPYDDNLNRGNIVPSATNTLLSSVDSGQIGTDGTAVDLGFAVGQHSCFLSFLGTAPTYTASVKIKGSPNNSDYVTIGTISYIASTGEATQYKSITGSPIRYIKARWDSAIGHVANTRFTVICVSGGN